MAYRAIVVEDEPAMMDSIVNTLRRSADFEVASTYKHAGAAINPAGMFHPDLFLLNVEEEESLFFRSGLIIRSTSCIKRTDFFQLFNHLRDMLLRLAALDFIEYIQLYSVRGEHKPAKLISFFSPKGRAGRTTLAAILALLIAEKTGERVALIDADLQFGDLPIFFDLEPKRTVVDATQDIKLLTPLTFAPYFYPIKDGVELLSSPDRPEYAELVAPESLTEVVQMAGSIFRYVLVDLPSGFNPVTLNVCRISSVVFVTTMINSGFEIKHAKKAMEMFASQDDGRRKVHAVFTRVNPFTEENRQKIADQLGFPVDEMIPNEYKMISVANSGRLAKGLPMDTLLMKTISGMADKIISAK